MKTKLEYASLGKNLKRQKKPLFRDRIRQEIAKAIRRPSDMTLVEWADKYRYLPSNSAEKGKFVSGRIKCAVKPMLSVTDPDIRRITIMSPTQLMKTELLLNAAFYHVHHDPKPIMFVLPTVNNARMISVERFTKSMRATPVLNEILEEYKGAGANTILQKDYQNTISFVSANNPGDLASRSVCILLCDEVDKYTRSAGLEGDPILIATERTEWFDGREKIIITCSPTIKGMSRVEEEYQSSNMSVYQHRCVDCGELFTPDFKQNVIIPGYSEGKPKPDKAYMICHLCEHVFTEGERIKSINDGDYLIQNPDVKDHAGYNMTRLSSPFPVVKKMANKRVLAGNDQNKIMVFVNTQEARSYQMKGMAFDWKTLYTRRESYKIGIIPDQAVEVYAGLDVQNDMVYREVIAVCKYMETYSIIADVFLGDIDDPKFRTKLAKKLKEKILDENGIPRKVNLTNIDAGYKTQSVYDLVALVDSPDTVCRAVNGTHSGGTSIAPPAAIKLTRGGKRRRSGIKLWKVNSSMIKEIIYGYYYLSPPTEEEIKEGAVYPSGYCHHPEHQDSYFKQVTAEVREEISDKRGKITHEWNVIRKDNHWLDCRVYAYAGALMNGLDELDSERWQERYLQRVISKRLTDGAKGTSNQKDRPPKKPIRTTRR